MKPKDGLFLGFAAALLALSLWAAKSALTTKQIVIKFPHSVAVNTPKGQGAEYFRRLVAERLGERVVVEVYPAASLMTDDTSIEALAFGEIQMVAVPLSKLDRLTKKFQIYDLPFLFPDIAAVERFQASAAGRSLLDSLEGKGFHGLGFWHNGMKQFSGPKPLREPGDAAGLKFRIMESDVLLAQIQAVGGNPQKMAFAEVYQALQTGAIDAQENTYSNIYTSKFYEVQDSIVESNHGFIGYLLATNSEFWRALPEDVRVSLEAIANETTAYVNARANAFNAEAKDKIIAAKRAKIIALTQAERAAWRQAMAPVWEIFTPDIGEELLAAALAAQTEAEKGALHAAP
ncbi:MAG: DctP family TRAP transporter solute-binding subunit [Pseudomonadota bacterium]